MMFNYVLGLQEIEEDVNVVHRDAVRAVILKNDKILMVHTNKGDYKFPGGGVKKEENNIDALKREVREETGYEVSEVNKNIGIIIERKTDEFEENSVFEMNSYYYTCDVSESKTSQELDDYEHEQNFKPVWIELEEAVRLNGENLKKDIADRNPWVARETMVLKLLTENWHRRKGVNTV